MRALLDTHALLWYLGGDSNLSVGARTLIASPQTKIIVSAASGWEIATKSRLGKLAVPETVATKLSSLALQYSWQTLPISMEHAQLAGQLPGEHKDPFDRMLAAQAILEDLPVVSNDAALAQFGARLIW